MTKTAQTLEVLFQKVRALPAREQELIAEALADLTAHVYHLSDDEARLLMPELDGARRGEFAPGASVQDVLNTPWKKTRAS